MRLVFSSSRFVVASAAAAILAIGCSAAPTEPSAGPATVPSVSAGTVPGVPAPVTQAIAAGLGPAELTARGWLCVVPPPTPGRIVCSHPNQGLPSPATPVEDRKAVYTLLVFDSSGAFLGTQIVLREDLYRGQVCRSTDGPYIHRALIGYKDAPHDVRRDGEKVRAVLPLHAPLVTSLRYAS